MGKTQGLDPISQHVPHTSTHTFKMEFLTPYHSSREVPAPAMPTARMPPSPAASREQNPYLYRKQSSSNGQTDCPAARGLCTISHPPP